MTIEEMIKSLTTIRDGYLKLIDEKVDSGKVVGTDGLRGEWKSNTPLDDIYRHSAEALEMAIKALEQESITWIVGKDNCQVAVRNMPIYKIQKICAIIRDEEQQPCEDCVSRQAAIEVIYDKYYDNAIAHDIVGMLFDLPLVKPQRPKGKWIEQTDKNKKLYGWFYCSECGAVLGRVDGANYCSECGAEMEGDNE